MVNKLSAHTQVPLFVRSNKSPTHTNLSSRRNLNIQQGQDSDLTRHKVTSLWWCLMASLSGISKGPLSLVRQGCLLSLIVLGFHLNLGEAYTYICLCMYISRHTPTKTGFHFPLFLFVAFPAVPYPTSVQFSSGTLSYFGQSVC